MPDSLTEKELKDIYSDHVLGIFLLDRNRQIKSMNKKAVEILGYEKEEVKGKNIKFFYKSNEDYKRVGRLYTEELKAGKEIKEQVQLIKKNGEKIWVEIIGKKIEKNYRWFIRDINNLKKMELKIKMKQKELENLKRKIEFLNHEKRDFVSNLSHELRTPLNAIIGFSDILKDDEKDEDRLEKLDMIKESGLKLLTLTNKIVNNITIDINGNKNDEIDIKDIIISFYEIYEDKLENSGIKLNINIDKNIPKILVGNQEKIEHIILNLIKKSIKLISSGEILIHFKYKNSLIIRIKIQSSLEKEFKDVEFDMIKQLLNHINGTCKTWKERKGEKIEKNIEIKIPMKNKLTKNKNKEDISKYKIDNFKEVDKEELKDIQRRLEKNYRVFSKEKVIKLGEDIKKISKNMNFIGDEIIDSGKDYNTKKLRNILEKIKDYIGG
ncbi:MAG: PAS domain S-box protein [Fusobacteriota bacterium]